MFSHTTGFSSAQTCPCTDSPVASKGWRLCQSAHNTILYVRIPMRPLVQPCTIPTDVYTIPLELCLTPIPTETRRVSFEKGSLDGKMAKAIRSCSFLQGGQCRHTSIEQNIQRTSVCKQDGGTFSPSLVRFLLTSPRTPFPHHRCFFYIFTSRSPA